MYQQSFSYSNNNSKNILDNNGLNENVINEIINNPEYNDVKFISWDGSKLINKNELPSNYKTCQNIVLTKNTKISYYDHETNSTKSKIDSQSEIVIFLI